MLSLHDRAARPAAKPPLLILLLAVLLLLPSAAAQAAVETTTAVQVLGASVTHGQRATLRADVTVKGSMPVVIVQEGTVQFKVDGTNLGAAVPLVNGAAQVQTQPLAAGPHTLQAFYLGQADYLGSDGATPVTVGQALTTTTMRITPDSGAVAGQDLVLEAAVKPVDSELGAPTGTVTALVNGSLLGTAQLAADGTLRQLMMLPAASMTVNLFYNGDANHRPSNAATAVTVTKAGTVIALTATPSTPTVGQQVEIRAMVDSLAPSLWYPAGTLTAAVDGQPVPGSATFDGDGGYAAFKPTFSVPGVHRITAHFTGDANFLAADATLDLTVTGAVYGAPARPVAPRGLTVQATPSRDRSAPYTYTVKGKLQLPSSVTAAAGNTGKVTVTAKVKGKRVASKTVALKRDGTYKAVLTERKKGTVSITATFGGNASLQPMTSRAVKVKAG
jgi:hypothetical protein